MIIKMYVTLMPVILAGVFNMIFVKLPILNTLYVPIDFSFDFIDKKRIFGENKTFKGALGMIAGGALFFVLWGFILKALNLESYNLFYLHHAHTLTFDIYIGFLLGLTYILFEFPNSFVKRRIGIAPGKVSDGKIKYLFVFMDQADSIIGCVFVVHLFYPLTLMQFVLFVMLGAFTHIIINCVLFFFKLRRNMF